MRRLLNTLFITNKTMYLALDGENVVCKNDGKESFRIPFTNIEEIYCFNYSGASPALMGKCAEMGVALAFFEPGGKFLARIQGKTKGNIFLRKAQYEKFSEPQVQLMQNTIAAKLTNSITLIEHFMHDHKHLASDNDLQGCITKLSEGIHAVYNLQDRDTLMGIEGNCAKEYFRAFNKLILQQKDQFHITNRTKHPPLDPVNAVLSFLYTVMTTQYVSALEAVGLDSAYGYYHALRSGRASLACDLVEETRHIAERVVLTLINLQILSPDDFEQHENGAAYLNGEGRKKVLNAWQEKKKAVTFHSGIGEKIPFGLLPFVQSKLLANYLRGERSEYAPYLAGKV